MADEEWGVVEIEIYRRTEFVREVRRRSEALTALPVLRETLWARFGGVLLMKGVSDGLARIIVEGVSQDPVGRIVGDWVTDPFDVVE